MILKNKPVTYRLLALVLAMALSVALNYSWPLLLVGTLMLILYLPLPQKVGRYLSIRVLVSVLLVLSIFQIIGFISYLFGAHMNVFLYNILSTTAITIFSLTFKKQDIKANAEDIWIVIAPVIIVGVVAGSMLTLTAKIGIENAVIYKTTTSTDESQHLYMLAKHINNDSNMTESPVTYPTGWHLSTSVAIQSFTDLTKMPFMNTLVAYYITKMLGLFMVIMSLMGLFVVFAKKTITNYRQYYLLCLLGVGLCSLILIIPNSEINAFYNFVPQYSYFLIMLILLINDDKKNNKILFSILTIFTLASFLSWVISGILLAIFTGVVIVLRYCDNIKVRSATLSKISKVWQPVTLILLCLGVLSVALPGGLVGRALDVLEHPEGWIEGINQLTYFVLFLILIGQLLKTKGSFLTKEVRYILLTYFFILAGIFAVASLRGYNESLSYYWQKIEFPLLVMTIPLALVIITRSIQDISKNVITTYVAVIILISFSIPNIIGIRSFNLSLRSLGNQSYLHKSRELNITKPIKSLFEKNKFKSNTAPRYIFVTSPNFTLDQMVYQLMSESISSNHNDAVVSKCFPPINPSAGYVGNNAVLLKSVPDIYCGHKVWIVVSSSTINDTRKYIKSKQTINIDDNKGARDIR